MTRRRKRQIATIVALSLLLAMIGGLYLNFRATKTVGFDFAPSTTDSMNPPQYLYSFSGPASNRMTRPLGVLVVKDRVFVTDSRKGVIYEFRLDGSFVRTFGQGKLTTPLYIARNPRNGNLYVSDRRRRSVQIFSAEGKFLRTFDPRLPKDQLPKFGTKDMIWAPVALAFAPDGTLYATEILNGHRLLVFGPDGKFKRSVGTAVLVSEAKKGGGNFQFPNSIKVLGKEVWVSDSNNRRLQVFDLDGTFQRILATEGLPRGFDFLPGDAGGSKAKKPRMVVIDTLAHDATVWGSEGKKYANFGGQGVLEGQFNYPNDLAVGPRARIFVTDTANSRVQVWGWPQNINPVPTPRIPQQWGWCLTPLLLLPLLLLLRKRRFFATSDFIQGMLDDGLVYAMPAARRRWMVSAETYETFKSVVQDDVDLGELLNVEEHSESDAQALIDRLELDHASAVVLSMAKRAHIFCTEDADLRRYAKVLDIDVVDCQEFIQRFPAKGAKAVKEAA